MPDEFTPPNDVADQQVPARPEDAVEHEVARVPADADVADFLDQRREAPVLADGEPWP